MYVIALPTLIRKYRYRGSVYRYIGEKKSNISTVTLRRGQKYSYQSMPSTQRRSKVAIDGGRRGYLTVNLTLHADPQTMRIKCIQSAVHGFECEIQRACAERLDTDPNSSIRTSDTRSAHP